MSRESEDLGTTWRDLAVKNRNLLHEAVKLMQEAEAEVVRLRTALREAERFCARSGACGATIRDALCNES